METSPAELTAESEREPLADFQRRLDSLAEVLMAANAIAQRDSRQIHNLGTSLERLNNSLCDLRATLERVREPVEVLRLPRLVSIVRKVRQFIRDLQGGLMTTMRRRAA